MAEFSKQYQEAFNFDWNDFDYEEIYKNLDKHICESCSVKVFHECQNDGVKIL